jgi:hypothetical protein
MENPLFEGVQSATLFLIFGFPEREFSTDAGKV